MKKIKYNLVYSMLLVFLALTSVLMTSCEKDLSLAPVIKEIRNYAASPNDTIVSSINPGQWIVLQGENLSTVSKVTFCGIPATIKSALFSDGNLVVEIPEISYETVPSSDFNMVEATSADGTATYQIDIIGKPLITRIRNFSDSPNDTILRSILPGQRINIIGFNLKSPTRISFQGVNADLSVVEYTDSSAVVQVPTNLSGGDASQVNIIRYSSIVGYGDYSIKIYGPPVILTVSHEFPLAGDTVYVSGSNLSQIMNLTFAGSAITTFEESEDGSSVWFISPALTQSGPIVVTSPGGSFTSAYNVNDKVTGRITDFEWGDTFKWEWWGGASGPKSGMSEFVGNPTQYLLMDLSTIGSGEGANWSHAIRIQTVKWIDPENISDPVGSWALKFEMNVAKDWNGSSLCIVGDEGDSYMFRLEPWRVSSSRTAAYKTKGWITVTVPLSEFRTKDQTLGDGYGAQVGSLTGLLGYDGTSVLQLYLHNYGAERTKTGFFAAFDNFRVVKR
jgi:hypothetical protein